MNKLKLSWISLSIFGIISGFFAQRAFAAGPGTGGRRVRLDNELTGPYRVRVVTSPTPPLVDNLYVEVGVWLDATGQVVTDATVMVMASSLETPSEPLEAEATHDIAPIPTEYAAHLLVPHAGIWEVRVTIDSPLGVGEVELLVRISDPPAIGALLAVGAPIMGLFVLAAIFYWLQKNAKQNPSKRSS